ncbi:MAG: winged helix-turn-helix domain-containing protein [Geopsychrobacter sp.]|nr:winged helix-turn-helix domain-containing protein [Geopsychrobacter sp.]
MPGAKTMNFAQDNKFIAPTVSPESFLSRDNLLNKLSGQGLDDEKVILVQAQAGQGKTIFAAQILEHLRLPFVWYQITKEDADPVFFLAALLSGLKRKHPEFDTAFYDQMVASGGISQENLPPLLHALTAEISDKLQDPCVFAFDDLHLIGNSSAANSVLTKLIEFSPPMMKFLLISRHGIGLPTTTSLSITNDSLLLTKTEIARLFNEYLQVPVSKSEVNSLADISLGWLAALLLLGERMRHQKENKTPKLMNIGKLTNTDEISGFFEQETFSTFENSLIGRLARLALMEEIPLQLAEIITGDKKIGKSLRGLVEKNLFVRQLGGELDIFIFHALFREALLKKVPDFMSLEDKHELLHRIGGYYVGRKEYVQAIKYFLQAEDFATAEQVLRQVGMGLIAINQTATLAVMLRQIPQDVTDDSAWLCLYSGILSLNTDPNLSYQFYEKARTVFLAQGDEWGEMLVLAQFIHYHLYVDGRHNLGRPHLLRLEELFLVQQDGLDQIPLMRFANAIAGGYCFFEFDAGKIEFYSKIALDTAENLDLPNYLAPLRIVNCYRYSFVGNWHAFHEEMELSLPLLGSPRVSLEHKLGLLVAQISVLIMTGDFGNYQRKKEWLLNSAGKSLTALSVIAPFLAIYDINLQLAGGQYLEARKTIETGLQTRGAGAIPHQRSQILHFLALVEAVEGNRAAAIAAAEKSRRLRVEVGSGRFDALNLHILGTTYTLIGDYSVAQNFFNDAREIVMVMQEDHLLAAVHFNRAFLFMKMGREDEAKEDLSVALTQMKRHNFGYFFGWLPEIVQVVLQAAVDWGVQADFAQDLARKRLDCCLSRAKAPLPIVEIRMMGRFELYMERSKVADEANFSPIQRQCLALLLVSSGNCLSQEQLQVMLWPESPEAKARSNFDTMLSRLRKVLAPLVAPHPVKSYLYLHRGLLRLGNVEIDAQRFRRFALSGLKSAQQECLWQAENELHQAMAAWSGKPLPNLPSNEIVDAARFELENLYLETANLWAGILAAHNRVHDAEEVLSGALLVNPTAHDLVQGLYHLHVQAGKPAMAARVLQNYRKCLQREEYLPLEIEEIMESFWVTA